MRIQQENGEGENNGSKISPSSSGAKHQYRSLKVPSRNWETSSELILLSETNMNEKLVTIIKV